MAERDWKPTPGKIQTYNNIQGTKCLWCNCRWETIRHGTVWVEEWIVADTNNKAPHNHRTYNSLIEAMIKE